VASKLISVRLDEPAQRALDELTRGGRDRSEAVRLALVEASSRHRRAALRAEALALVADEADRAELAEIAALMESLRAEG
jgi:Arc/MetJ-type ribon-helix-helix transcriptional regulator